MLRYYIFAAAILLLDQATKWLVMKKMHLYESIPLWEGVFHITSHRNRGAAFGILQDQRWLFILVTCAVLAAIVFYLMRIGKSQPMLSWSLALILGGAIGNLVDRIRFGEVVDFLDFRYINFAIFNIADSAICIGVALMLLVTLRQSEGESEGAAKEKLVQKAGDSQ
ncbi:signal peptidase II Aspartic peptidase. MEROPS family A08 [Marininema mesophilum]|uniref:Lipoprotein signal peptidase n=1 Tax=Marininema mesophilum TaxID=1048340 RepID=A0A1H2QE27_9BACL|nr:signal peptidase II Aspartic peptidase. MEROPS family A08 [Marininema mesophilum]